MERLFTPRFLFMSKIHELCKQVLTLSGATSLGVFRVGHLLVQWFQSSSLAQHQLKVALAELGPQIHDDACKAVVA